MVVCVDPGGAVGTPAEALVAATAASSITAISSAPARAPDADKKERIPIPNTARYRYEHTQEHCGA